MRSYNYLLFFVAHDLHRSRRFPSHFTCLSDNMFGLSDIQRIPSAGTPLIQQLLAGHWKKAPNHLSRQHFPVTPRLHKMIYWNSWDVLAVVKPHARHRDAVAAGQALTAQWSVPVSVAKVVSMKEQGKLFRQTTMTKMNRCISTEPGMGSEQPVWKLFNMVTMTTIHFKLIHHCYWIYFSQFCMPRKCEERAIRWSCLY